MTARPLGTGLGRGEPIPDAPVASVDSLPSEVEWLRAMMAAIRDGLVVFDAEGLVLELNQAFTDLLGYSLADGPIRPPYPWWPTEAEDPAALAEIRQGYAAAQAGQEVAGEFRFYRRDRKPVWVWSGGGPIRHSDGGPTAYVRTVRDITREKDAQARRAAAAQVSADFATTDDLATLLGVAEHGFDLLFDGDSTILLSTPGGEHLFGGGRTITRDELQAEAGTGLAGQPSADTKRLRPGILLVPRTSAHGCRAWIQFPRPRRIGVDEMIAADLLAQAFSLAVDRLIDAEQTADRQANLQQAIESHRVIGQAIGILVERHRLLPGQAFDRLKDASQNRNLKLREIAARVIETGAEPDCA